MNSAIDTPVNVRMSLKTPTLLTTEKKNIVTKKEIKEPNSGVKPTPFDNKEKDNSGSKKDQKVEP